MTSSPVSFQGFTHENDMCDTLKLSHPRGAPQRKGHARAIQASNEGSLLFATRAENEGVGGGKIAVIARHRRHRA
jgi:hypothetical protein